MPIISPWIFYLIEVLSTIKIVFIVALILILICCVIVLAGSIDEWYSEEMKMIKPWLKKGVIASILLGIAAIFTPSQETLYKMVIANYVTYENIETATDTIKDSVDYIFEKLDKEEEK